MHEVGAEVPTYKEIPVDTVMRVKRSEVPS